MCTGTHVCGMWKPENNSWYSSLGPFCFSFPERGFLTWLVQELPNQGILIGCGAQGAICFPFPVLGLQVCVCYPVCPARFSKGDPGD